ncbi:NADH:flavin oxidoreductase/NADH oxidase [Plasticicumulans acidivorans]|uniref:2,4-dienoyl-CoA reductase-like NADH-dependent reductase (Old Yellow Enzyme family) n=1 Tax=Plasticicumulans acidivorans TaxID=886464 RepID=A0A317MSB4_9GAMM|nr:NADH:flavin oxidoreductase/NADH oxidase [Plasticicumulans acidivorans]PWV59875.1 2,4-dienoyl-CoA reductase-like NADH-dependent reductase (Old Yellow Enzyme family) [Plasticicumulans acidivorans]
MSHLFEPLSLGGLQLPNRIVIAPMCQYSAEDGDASDWHLIHLGQLAFSGAGLLILEATAVSPEGRISPSDIGLWSDDNEAALARVLSGVRRYSTMPLAVQLAHAGRKASTQLPWLGGGQLAPEAGGWQTVAPSALAHTDGDVPPLALDHAGLARIREAFAAAAARAARLGLDGVELHAAHGYLLHQFLSPLSNRREDAYGGSLENRLRFPLEVFEAIRAQFPAERPVWVRVSASDWVPGGWDIDGTIAFAQALAARGCAAIHVSSGGLSNAQQIPLQAGYQVAFAQAVKAAVEVPVIAVGLITEPEHAESIIASGQADAVALARAMLYEPHWPWHAAARLGASVQVPPQYWRAPPHGVKGLFTAG